MIETEGHFALLFCLKVFVLCVQLTNAEHSCNFNYGLCSGWSQNYYQDVFDWTNRDGSTPSSSTGPSSGHGGYGRYMYIETSLPRQYGDNAKLEFSVSSSDIGELSCLGFYYHMYGYTVNTLNVFNGNTRVFTKSGNQGNQWLKAEISMTLGSKITFEGIRGTDYTSDIAIDDVSITAGICQGCTENVNKSFGRLDITYTNKFDPYCNWIIRSTGITQAVAIVSINQIYFASSREYVKIFDGNGTEVFALSGWVSSTKKTFHEISFGESKNITIQVSLVYSWTYVKIDYGTLNQGLDSAFPLADLNVTVVNRTTKSIGIVWNDPINLHSGGVRFYVALARKTNSSSDSIGKIVPGNTTTSKITDLDTYTEYNVSVVVVNVNGTQFKTADVLTRTDEGVPSRAPNWLRVTSFEFTSDLLVEWNPLSQYYANGKLLGYTIYYRENNYYWAPYQSVNTSSPYPTRLKLKDLKPGKQYRVQAAAFTSKGVGPWSYSYYATTGCSIVLNESFGHIDYTATSYNYLRCSWIIQNAGICEAIALISVEEINLQYCSEYARITDGNSTEVLYHNGCAGPFAPEILTDVHLGLSNNISVQVYTGSSSRNINIKFAILKKGLTSAVLVSGWNLTILNADSTSFTLQWTGLNANVNHRARFYLIEVKSAERILLAVETVPGNTSSTYIKGLSPSSKYRVVVFGVDETGQPYKSLESVVTTKKVFCGVRPSTTRIVGGTVAQVNSWPWQAMLINSYGRQFCGGSLVDRYWVVTAAHCVYASSPFSIKIRLGAHYRTSGSVGTEQDIGIARIIRHENYNSPISYSNDIALLNLASPADIGVGVGLVCLPDTSHQLPLDNINKKCWITGWGTTSSGGPTPNSLMQAEVPLVSKQRCESAYPDQIDDSMLCAGLDVGGVDSCQGDSGGPLVCEFNGTWYLEGATSWGYGCAVARKYGVYAKLRDFKSWLSTNMYTVVSPSASPPTQSPSALVWCNFDNGLCSGWIQSPSDDFDWTLASGSTPSSSTGPNSGQGGSGKYMYIETSSPRKPGENAKLVLTVPDNGKRSCLSFYYHMYGASAGTLNVYNGNHTIFNVSGNQGNNWLIVERDVYLDREIIFEGITGGSYTGDVAIDQVKVTEGKCPVSCSFDNGLCLGWSQSKSDVFDWTLNSGSTPSSSTGPSSGHGGSGKYMYIEATYQSTGDNAKLQLAVPRGKSSSCLTFFYHMYGRSTGTLNVFNGNVKIFTKSGNQGNYWKKVSRTLHLSDVLTFEGIRGASYTSDIAIDDVTVLEGNCPGCGGVLNKSFGELDVGNSGDESESHCNWTIGSAGIRQAVAIISLQRIYFGYCSEHFRILHSNGTEVFNYEGCQSSLPSGTSLEVPIGVANHIILQIFLEYRWSAVKLQYDILNQGLDSASQASWNITVYSITSSSASVRWLNFPLSLSVTHFLVRYKEHNGVSTLFRASSYSNTHYTNRLKAYTSYDVQVFAFTTSIDANITYSSLTVSIKTPEGVPSRAPTNVQLTNHGLNEFLVQWDPVPLQHINGRLLGYSVYYKDTQYYYSLERTVNTSNPDESHVILTGIQTGQRYQISVAAFTSKGQGPRSSYLYITKNCKGFVNQSSGWLNFTHTDYNTLSCSVEIRSAGMRQGVALISFQYIYFGYCSEFVKIFDSEGVEVYGRRGCNSITSGLAVEIPFSGGSSITLAATLSYRYSYIRVQYTILDQALSSAQLLPSWNLTVTHTTSSSLTVKWSKFPLTNVFIQRFLVKYREHNSNVSLIFKAPNSYNTHYTGTLLKSYQFYDVQVIAVTSVGNGTYSSQTEPTRTDEGVPSSAPSNVTLKNLKFDEVMVQWDPIPPHTANGILLGYRVYLHEYNYWYYSLTNTVNTSSPSVHMVILRGLKAAHRYRISVVAFTSKGAGPQSYWRYITTGCGGYINESFGQLHIDDYRGSSYVRCNWEIGSVGISQAVAFVWIQDLYLSYSYEYLRILNGSGSVVLNQNGYVYSSAARKTFLEVDFGKEDNITVQVYLSYRYSHFKLQYGIMKQGIQSALLVPNWNITVENTTRTSIIFNWQNLTPVINKMVLHYIVQIRNKNGSDVLHAMVVNGNTTYVNIAGLSPYTEYQVSVVGVTNDGQPYKSSNVTALTEEGVPSRGPSNLRLSNVQTGEVKVQWEPLPQQYANGRILGYSIYVYEYDYYVRYIKTVNSNSPGVHMVIVRGLKAAQRYRISVAAFTSKGVGPQSYYGYITTGCGGSINQSFGELQVGRRSYYSSYLRCSWAIGSAGISQAVLVVSLQELSLSYNYEYIKIIDGDGSTAFYRYGYSSSPWKTFLEVKYGNATNVTVEIYLTSYWSQFKLQYGIVKQGLQSAPLIANWSVSIGNTTKNSITIQWPNLTPILNEPVLHYFGLIKSTNGSILNCHIMSANTTSVAFTGLSSYSEYRLSVVGVNGIGQAYSSAEVTAWTEEGVPSRAPSNISFTNVKSTEVTVNWNPLSEQYANGRLLGYRVYFQETAYYSVSSNRSSVNVTTNSTRVTLTGLRPGQRYHTYISAFTSKGAGPRSYFYYITTACKITINQSAGLIDVAQTDYNYLNCYWTIGNVGITHAVALFLIHKLDLSYCSEFVKIFDGNGTVQFYQTGCWPSFSTRFVEVPFGKSSNITVNIQFRKLHSLVNVEFVVLKTGLNSAAVFPGWTVSVDNTTSTSILIQWANLTSLINRQVLHYIVLLNGTDGNALAYEVTDGSRLSSEIGGLKYSTNYGATVFGVDEGGRPYKTLEVNATTKNISCGSRPSSSRIVGGTIAPVNSWPWQAMLRDSRGRQFCGGSLIDPLWVVTATHCIYGKSASSVKVRLGAHYRSYGTAGTEQDFDVAKIIQHENYNIPFSWSNDIALLQLSKPAKLGKGVGLVCLSDVKYQLPFDDLNTTCWITGWGTLSYLGITPNELMQVDVPLVSKQRCNASYPGKIDDSMMCIGKDQGGEGACHGDSGGPLVCEFDGKWYLEGATSWGGLPCAAPSKYTVYANIRYLKSWIKSKINDASTPASTSCDFDLGLCSGWRQSNSDIFDWTRRSGSTSSLDTGPDYDHTSGSGYYMYIETSSPRVVGDNAKLSFSVSGNKQLFCLKFYYHMYGDTMGTLTVFSGNLAVFNASGNHGNYWNEAKVNIYLDNVVTFEGIRGLSFTGDLAIDDVSISSGSCFGQTAAPPTFPTASTHKPSAHPTSSPAGCSDKPGFLNCASLPHYGNFCIVHSNWTKEYCAKSCGFCGVECSDNPQFAAVCSSVSSLGNACLAQYNWTMENCRKSCGFCIDNQDNPPTTNLAPQMPSNESIQESVMLEIRDLDVTKWDEQMKDDFKREVGRVATEYCAADETRCQVTPTSSRRKRSSEEMVFSGNMVHIIPGYPMQSPENHRIALLAFYLQLPQRFSENVVPKDVLKDIVNSNMSSIGGSMNGTILSVQSLLTSSPDTFKGEQKEDDSSDEGSKPTSAIIGASIGGVLFFLIIVALVLTFKKKSNRRVHSRDRVDEGVVEGNEAVPGEVDGTVAIKRSHKDADNKKTSALEEYAAELKCDNRTRALENATDRKIEEQRPSTSADLHVTTSHSAVNKGFQDLESVRNIDEEKPTTFKQLERNEVESDSADDVVVLGSQPVPEEEQEDRAAARSDETISDDPVQQDKINKEEGSNKGVDEYVVVV